MITCAICPSCAREHQQDARLCTACGTPLTLATCAACDAINAIDALRCHQCGTGLAPAAPSVIRAHAGRDSTEESSVSPDAYPAFVLDAIDADGDAEDDFSALAGEKRYVGPDGGRHAFTDATPIAFAERVAHALPEPPSFIPPDMPRVAPRAPRASARLAHVGVAVVLVIAVGAGAYFAFDVPAMRAVVARALARADAFATLAMPARPARTVERTDKAVPNPAPSRAPDAAPSTPMPAAAPASEAASPVLDTPGRTTTDASANRVTPPSGVRTQVVEPATGKPRKPVVPRAASPRSRASTTRPVDRDALETQRLIARDLGGFLAK
jgi:hypothetical protein